MSFFRYPGGKHKLRKEISEHLVCRAREETQYREPFFGGGSIIQGVLDGNPNIKSIWINDKDIGIACLWTSVIRYVDELKQKIREFKPSVEAFHEFKKELTDISSCPDQKTGILDIGFKKLAIHQISYSGLGTKSGGPLGGEKQKSEYKIDCRWSPEYICNKANKSHQMFAGVSVKDDACTNLDFEELLGPGNYLAYLDPPYFEKGNVLYQCGFTEEDHRRLSVLLRENTNTWVLSYDDCPEIRSLYSWASFHQFDVNYTITATKNKRTGERLSTKKPELFIYPNGADQ